MKYSLRKATTEDISRINDLFVEMLQTIYDKEDVNGYNDGDLDHYFSGSEDWICVAEMDGMIVAFLAIEVHREQENYIYYDDFSVSKNYRNKGIGTALINEAEKYSKSISFITTVLHVERGNTSARRFYENKGFNVLQESETRLCLIKHLQ